MKRNANGVRQLIDVFLRDDVRDKPCCGIRDAYIFRVSEVYFQWMARNAVADGPLIDETRSV